MLKAILTVGGTIAAATGLLWVWQKMRGPQLPQQVAPQAGGAVSIGGAAIPKVALNALPGAQSAIGQAAIANADKLAEGAANLGAAIVGWVTPSNDETTDDIYADFDSSDDSDPDFLT